MGRRKTLFDVEHARAEREAARGVASFKTKIDEERFDDICIPNHRRPLDEEKVRALMGSIERIGLRYPITVRVDPADNDRLVLVAGWHRMEAFRRLGRERIPMIVLEGCDDVEAELWEIAENLHRAELTALERDEQTARWVELTEKKDAVQSAQDAPIESKRKDGRGHRKESGINKASRELGIERTKVQRAMKVAALSPEAKRAAREVGLDGNQSALLAAAKGRRRRPRSRSSRCTGRSVS